jgi:hypothetical protein
MTGKFHPGQIVATPGALGALKESGQQPADFLARHLAGDWGDLDAEDKSLNDLALKDGSRLFSAYHTKLGTKVYVITEAQDDDGNRAATTLLTPDEY